MSLLLAGFPQTVPDVTLNRLCASGLEAVGAAARDILAGEMGVTIAGGVESKTRAPSIMGKATGGFDRNQKLEDTIMGWRFVNPALDSTYGTDPMPRTAENLADYHGISRADQDGFALRSQQRAQPHWTVDFFAEEIVTLTIPGKPRGETGIFGADEYPRPDTTAADLARLKPLFGAGGTVTAGNASGINDGAAALVIASEQDIARNGLVPRARILGMASAGVELRIMSFGPAPSTRNLLRGLVTLCVSVGMGLSLAVERV
jgi:3-oxoadipyl-CoA thiolase